MLFYSFDYVFFFFKQKTAYEMRISDWSSDVCSSDLPSSRRLRIARCVRSSNQRRKSVDATNCAGTSDTCLRRSEEHTSELQSLMRISYAVFCLKKKKIKKTHKQCS